MRNKIIIPDLAVRDTVLRERLVEALEAMPVVIRSGEGKFPTVRVLGRDHSVAFTRRVYSLSIDGPFDVRSADETTCIVSKGTDEPPANLHPRRKGYLAYAYRISYAHRHANGRRAEYSFGINPHWVDFPPEEPQPTIQI